MNKQQVFNPYLPSWEYIPDGEPHKFDGRIYVYGSHDKFGGKTFCMNDYVCWSAPEDDLSDWRYEGVIWRKDQDPMNKNGKTPMYAPDVCRGPDGRYYLYYFCAYNGVIGVAVCDTPAGQYEFVDYVHYADGTRLGKRKGDIFQFDPGVYVEGDKVYLYTGFCPTFYPFFLTGGKPISRDGATVTVLRPDMVTVDKDPKYIAKCKRNSAGTDFEGHEFFEAASMRKINGKYYFIYSSFLGHELCYAIGDSPDGEFRYGGTIVSIGDVGLNGRTCPKNAANYTGNTHGSIVEACGKYYVFYHRQTNRHCFSRQACAEEITVNPDGSIPHVEVTSCGLNGGPLKGKGEYEARIACQLFSAKGCRFYSVFRGFEGSHPYFTQTGEDREGDGDQYIANMRDGATAGFKYFDFEGASDVTVRVRGNASGRMVVFAEEGEPAAFVKISPSKDYTDFSAPLKISDGVHALYFRFEGKGRLDFDKFTLK
ncbi:MAG TPA: family 43 glycosylhydrolase [Firmicutes bacterium]|nr:family 43 glycosylhydrolase [Bacillota bacterium]